MSGFIILSKTLCLHSSQTQLNTLTNVVITTFCECATQRQCRTPPVPTAPAPVAVALPNAACARPTTPLVVNTGKAPVPAASCGTCIIFFFGGLGRLGTLVNFWQCIQTIQLVTRAVVSPHTSGSHLLGSRCHARMVFLNVCKLAERSTNGTLHIFYIHTEMSWGLARTNEDVMRNIQSNTSCGTFLWDVYARV